MSYQVRYTAAARADLQRHFAFLIAHDPSIELLKQFLFTCRKATPENPFLREMVISFGATGYVALFEIENSETITILVIRHQCENDFH